MPTYHYRCSSCGHSFDFFQRFSDDPLTVCPECEGQIRRVPQPVGIVFKGSGWYITDNRDAKKSDGRSRESVPKEKSDTKDSSETKTPAAVGEH
jgi:putative FmdB family regulatory protein